MKNTIVLGILLINAIGFNSEARNSHIRRLAVENKRAVEISVEPFVPVEEGDVLDVSPEQYTGERIERNDHIEINVAELDQSRDPIVCIWGGGLDTPELHTVPVDETPEVISPIKPPFVHSSEVYICSAQVKFYSMLSPLTFRSKGTTLEQAKRNLGLRGVIANGCSQTESATNRGGNSGEYSMTCEVYKNPSYGSPAVTVEKESSQFSCHEHFPIENPVDL